ncbi:DUF1080 domain-containing protein [Lentisphaera profundi]|uniref:DUF1080 domain-containing protein n=1 Tax=Lentisphaera profundi TaxID=1658616 RepID=A0ABY7VS64_9BACT|nr:DUF1080 domain-containing protein [Lentisphaera profundi]WDE96887.1 DUF1080 domain-containing protein [Lentisphaera profundi]
MQNFFRMALLVFLSIGSIQANEWKSLFNGKNLDGWKGLEQYWSVQDGIITGESKTAVPFTNFLIYEKGEFSDFELKFDFCIFSGNSGVQYRSKQVGKPEKFSMKGYQADFDPGNAWSGTNYFQGRGIMAKRGQKTLMEKGKKASSTEALGDFDELAKSIKAAGQWNSYHIIVKGDHFQHFINGVLMSECTDKDPKLSLAKGTFGLQMHKTKGTGMKVQFKNIELKELKDK